jgi:hypothetical protein
MQWMGTCRRTRYDARAPSRRTLVELFKLESWGGLGGGASSNMVFDESNVINKFNV